MKNKAKVVFVNFVFLLLVDYNTLSAISIKPIDYVSTFYSSTNLVTQQISQKYGLAVVGSGGGMMDSIYEMDIVFSAGYPLTHACAREILVYAAGAYLKAINENAPVRPFLRNFPFVLENLTISLFSHSNTVSESHPELTLTVAAIGPSGKLKFQGGEWTKASYSATGERVPSSYSYDIRETYEEAKAKLAACQS